MEVKGSCNCRAVQFDVVTQISDVYVCHCSICRKSTGSGGIAVSIVKNDDFSWEEGEEFIVTWQKPNHDWQSNFCKKCGSPLPGKNDEKTIYIPVDLLDSGNDNLVVRHHLFVASKGSWQIIQDEGIQHQENFSSENK